MDATADQPYAAAGRAVFASLGEGDGVIVDTQSAFYFGLNRTGAFLWKLVQRPEGATLEQLVAALCDKFTVEPADAERDARAFLEQVIKSGLAAVRDSMNAPAARVP